MEDAASPLRFPWTDPPETGAAIEIADGVLWMRLPLPMVLDHVNVYALDDGDDGWTIVDTGVNSRKSRDIWQSLLDGPLGGRPVHRVILTHHHPDHVGLVGWFQSVYGANLVTSRTAWLFSRMLTLDVQETPVQETVTFWQRAGMDPEILAQRLAERPFNFADLVWPMPLGFTRVEEGSRLTVGGRDWDVHFGQGHSPDHVTLWSRDDGLVIGGDQLLPTISPNLGVYATEPDADSVGAWIAACEHLAQFARDDQIVLTGHKLPFTGLPARLEQLISNHHTALDRLRTHLTEPRTAHDCFSPLFGRRIGSGEYGLALVESVGHLNHLYQLGETTRELRDDGAWLYRMR